MENIEFIFSTDVASSPERSREVSFSHPLNIASIVVTAEVSRPERLIEARR